MNRRIFMSTTAAISLSASAQNTQQEPQYFEMQWFYLRNNQTNQPQKANDYFSKVYAPALARLGLPPVGFLQPVISERNPYLLAILTHANLQSVETVNHRLEADNEYRKGTEAFLGGELPYQRREISVLRAFPHIPALTPPVTRPNHALRIFELRTYESNTSLTLQRKISMFEQGEAEIFRRLGMSPVFFGQEIIGRNIPSLTYMLAYNDLGSRDRLWQDFGKDEEWKKLRTAPGNSDAEIVSNISNMILRPTPFSQIK